MSKNVFLFAGQGSQYSGMGKEIVNICPQSKRIYDVASEVLGFNLAEMCFNGSDEELARTINSQPAIMATSLACFEAVKAKGIEFSAVAGHSLGEYAAMVASEMLSLEDGFKVIKARAEAMDKAGSENAGSMAAILKLKADEVAKACEEAEGYVVPVNYNSPIQTVIAGEIDAVANASAILSSKGARVMPLKVSSAFHSELMRSASEEFYSKIENIKFNAPKVSFYSNILGCELKDFSDMRTILAKHIISPVKFTDELENLFADGYTTFIELGPNKVLTGLVKKTLSGVTALNVENEKTYNEVSNI